MRRGPRIRTVIAGVAVLAGALIPAATPASAVDIFPSISVDQYPLDFGDVPIGVPTQRTLTVTNNRDETWTTPGLGVPAHFDVLGSNCWSPVRAHGTCIVIVQLLPTVPGRYEGSLQFAVGDGEFVDVPMIANALAPRSAALFPSPGSFGDVPVGTSRDVLVTVANDGSETWQLGEISTSDVSVGVPATECAGTIASGEQCTFVARFTPTAAGAVTATLTLFDEHGDALGGITLTGTGIVPTPVVRPVVAGLSPRRGSVRGGTRVTISGINLAGATSVTFGGRPARNVVCTETRCTVTTPSGRGTVLVRVTTPAGTSRAVSTAWFTYRA